MSWTEEIKEVLDRKDEFQQSLFPRLLDIDNLSDLEPDYPGLDAMGSSVEKVVAQLLLKGTRHFAGSDDWPTAMEALDATAGYYSGGAEAYLISVMCRGIAVGLEAHQLENMNRSDRHMLFHHGTFFEEHRMDDLVNEFAHLPELISNVGEYFAEQLCKFVDMSGFLQFTGKETVKVWDVWRLMFNAGGLNFYMYGIEIGKQHRINEEFNSIISESSSES